MMPDPPSAAALVAIECPDGSRRAVVRRDDQRLTLATVDAAGFAEPLFAPTEIERLIVFAEHAAAGHPAAITHPKAILFLATLALALVAIIETEKEEVP